MLVPNDGICTRKFKNETNREVNGTGAETLKWSQVLVHVTVFKHFGQCSAWKEIVDLFTACLTDPEREKFLLWVHWVPGFSYFGPGFAPGLLRVYSGFTPGLLRFD